MAHVLIVEDESDVAEMIAALVAQEKFSVAVAATLRDARRQIALQPPDVLLIDLHLPDGSGFELVENEPLRGRAEVVLITGHASVETSVKALRSGAVDYLIKPVSARQLRAVLARTLRPPEIDTNVTAMEVQLSQDGHFGSLWGRSAAMRELHQHIARVARTAVSVFITGESGTGKELVARMVHDLSRRRDKPFLAVNCGAISPHLFESEIFGHEKGSFTGADRLHQGFFERAHGGTLFLDEVTEMPRDLQVKLLRVLETGLFTRVGSTVAEEADVRVVAATNRAPEQAVREGKLREDLYYRLNVFPVALAPLRERLDDVPLLAQHFLAATSDREGEVKRFTDLALAKLSSYHWPGNVRELRNVVQRAYVMTVGSTVSGEWLPGSEANFERALAAPEPAKTKSSVTHPTRGPVVEVRVGTPLAAAEKRLILAALAHFNHHKERTAAALGISLKTLYNRLKKYAAEPDAPEHSPKAE